MQVQTLFNDKASTKPAKKVKGKSKPKANTGTQYTINFEFSN